MRGKDVLTRWNLLDGRRGRGRFDDAESGSVYLDDGSGENRRKGGCKEECCGGHHVDVAVCSGALLDGSPTNLIQHYSDSDSLNIYTYK